MNALERQRARKLARRRIYEVLALRRAVAGAASVATQALVENQAAPAVGAEPAKSGA